MAVSKRYQIFVSSTFADLKEERKMVMHAILERKGFPAGMELFPAKDKKQFDYIRQVINDSDYYLLIIGARYGSLDDDGVSYTEKEYDYAVSQKIPVIAFLHSDIKTIPLGKADVDKELQQKLEAFRAKVQTGRLVNYWENPHDLKAKVISSLVDAFEDQDRPRIGWVRADSVDDGDSQCQQLDSSYQVAQQEIYKLKKQIKNLNSELEKLKNPSVMIEAQTEVITIPDTNVSFKMVYVKGGTFLMGADDNDKDADFKEKPAHEVTLYDYWIGETLVTQELWQAVMDYNPSVFTSELGLPVECVSWIDCQVFIERLKEKTGRNFHLPTEAQWEFAARGGNLGKESGYRFAGRNYDLDRIAWYDKNSGRKTHSVAGKHPNQLGIYDMSGNVWEWCNDFYEYYRESPLREPKGPASGYARVCRGGSWIDSDNRCNISFRDYQNPHHSNYNLGLRLAL